MELPHDYTPDESPDQGTASWALDQELTAVATAALERGRVARVLLKTPEIRVVVVGMRRGAIWPEHAAAGRVVVHVVRGSLELRTQRGNRQLAAGMMTSLDPGEAHDVYALDDSSFVLVVTG
jgi:quercetin dioxygenase-like cupin family protein